MGVPVLEIHSRKPQGHRKKVTLILALTLALTFTIILILTLILILILNLILNLTLTQSHRRKVSETFRKTPGQILFTSDVSARGSSPTRHMQVLTQTRYRHGLS